MPKNEANSNPTRENQVKKCCLEKGLGLIGGNVEGPEDRQKVKCNLQKLHPSARNIPHGI